MHTQWGSHILVESANWKSDAGQEVTRKGSVHGWIFLLDVRLVSLFSSLQAVQIDYGPFGIFALVT